MPRFFALLVAAGLLLLVAAPSARAQTAFLNEFHTDDAGSGIFDDDGDGTFDQFTDLEFVEFAIETASGQAFGARDVWALFYDKDGAYTGFAIAPALWEAGQMQGDYRVYAFGPFSIPLDQAPDNPPRGALADGVGAVALAYDDGTDLVLLELLSYGRAVTLPNDRWFGTVTATRCRWTKIRARARTSTTAPSSRSASPARSTTAAATASRRRPACPSPPLRPATRRLHASTAPRPACALPPRASTTSADASATPSAARARLTAAACPAPSPCPMLRPSAKTESAGRPPGLTWTTCANTASPGAVNFNEALPVELTAFDATQVGTGAVRLTWATAAETGNAGFYVERTTEAETYAVEGFVEGAGTTTVPQTYAFTVDALTPGRHTFRLRQVDFDGQLAYSPEVEVTLDAPGDFYLGPAFPNPFRRMTTVTLALDRAQDVRVEVFDVLGRAVATLHDGPLAAGDVHRFDFHPAGRGLATGVYFVRAVGETFSDTRRVVLVR